MRAPITMKGAQKLRDELDHLKSVKRPKVIAAIAEAREPVSYTHLTLPTNREV